MSGGGYDNRNFRADGARLDLTTRRWRSLSANVPIGIEKPESAWTGKSLLVSAGSSSGQSGAFGRFDLKSRAWGETVQLQGRIGHSFVWTGSRALFWGGRMGPWWAPEYQSGGWELTGEGLIEGVFPWMDEMPSARAFHSSIWTGSEMIVWGGKNARTLFGDGARWSPSSRSWTPVQTNNAPVARINHSAVWTGNSMIIWGGERDSESPVAGILLGGIYHPASDSWESIGGLWSTVGHTAVWTGSEMLIWGGTKRQIPETSAGFGYRPNGRQWHRLSSDLAPAAVQGHSAVWTGKEMIVWGGLNLRGEPLGEGARYVPALEKWFPMSVASPPARAFHAAVWTGDSMLIWGGTGAGTFGDTWEYVPPQDTDPSSDVITLRWPVTGDSFRLQTAASLTEPDWQDVPGSPTQTNSVWTVTLPVNDASGASFRLVAE